MNAQPNNQNQNANPENNIGTIAFKLSVALDEWRDASENAKRTSSAKADARRENSAKAVSDIVENACLKFGVIVAAFGISNAETGKFDLLRNCPSLGDPEIFPFPPPTGTVPLFAKLKTSLAKEKSRNFDYSDWMHGLFGIQRGEETLGATDGIKMPEYFQGKNPLGIIRTHSEICNIIREWILLWQAAANAPCGLASTLEMAAPLQKEFSGVPILTLIRSAWEKIPESLREPYKSIINELPEHSFFPESFGERNSDDDDWILQIAAIVDSSVDCTALKDTFSVDHIHDCFEFMKSERSDITLVSLIGLLHKRALFPIIPYYYLNLLENRPLNHFFLPILKTTGFPLSKNQGRELEGLDSDSARWGVAFLGVHSGNESAEMLQERLMTLCLLMRLAAEPLTDTVFYGGIQRRRTFTAGTDMIRRGLAHQIKKVSFAAGQGWLVTPNRWASIQQSLAEQKDYRTQISAHLIAPVPNLYNALSTTLFLWSFSYEPSDLFPECDFPNDLADLAEVAWTYARANTYVIDGLQWNFNSKADAVEEAWLYEGKEKRSLDVKSLKEWKIDHAAFKDAEQFKLSEDNQAAYKVLSGILRALVVASENFLKFNPHCSKLTIGIETEGEYHCIICSNRKRFGIDQIIKDHMGLRGLELVNYLCREFINSASSFTRESNGIFNLVIPIGTPKWLQKSL